MICSRNDRTCGTAEWTCKSCGRSFCHRHSTVTSLGRDVECGSCEEARLSGLASAIKQPTFLKAGQAADRLDKTKFS